jgi:hypothetical protein
MPNFELWLSSSNERYDIIASGREAGGLKL